MERPEPNGQSCWKVKSSKVVFPQKVVRLCDKWWGGVGEKEA